MLMRTNKFRTSVNHQNGEIHEARKRAIEVLHCSNADNLFNWVNVLQRGIGKGCSFLVVFPTVFYKVKIRCSLRRLEPKQSDNTEEKRKGDRVGESVVGTRRG